MAADSDTVADLSRTWCGLGATTLWEIIKLWFNMGFDLLEPREDVTWTLGSPHRLNGVNIRSLHRRGVLSECRGIYSLSVEVESCSPNVSDIVSLVACRLGDCSFGRVKDSSSFGSTLDLRAAPASKVDLDGAASATDNHQMKVRLRVVHCLVLGPSGDEGEIPRPELMPLRLLVVPFGLREERALSRYRVDDGFLDRVKKGSG